MDILYKLPFPKPVCSKILLFTCKSPHRDLGSGILKNIIGLSVYNKLIKNGGIVLDDKGDVVEFRVWNKKENELLNMDERKQMTFDIVHLKCFPKLTSIDLFMTGVRGDIIHLNSLSNLTKIDIGLTFGNLYGDIMHLKPLQNLTMIGLTDTGVTGDIVQLNSLHKLSDISFMYTAIKGDITNIKMLPKLSEVYLVSTGVIGDKNAFKEYRETAMLKKCYLYL